MARTPPLSDDKSCPSSRKTCLRWCRTSPGNCGRKSLLFGSCLNALIPSIRRRNFHHSCKICQLSFDLVKKNERFSCFHLANFPFENETPFYFGIGFLENCRTDCNQNLPSSFSSYELTIYQKRMNFHHRSAMLLLIKLFLYVFVIFFCSLWWISEPPVSFESPLLQFCFLILLLKFSLPVSSN